MKLWSQPLRVETPQFAVLTTIRTVNSALWFVNCKELEIHTLGYLAKYVSKYDVLLHGVAIEGNHIHLVARFPHANRAGFMRDFNARVAEGVRKYVKDFPGGPVFGRRYTSNILPTQEDVEKYFFYVALQSVQDGLCETISEYPAYNGVFDAINNKVKKFKVVRWGEFNAKRRFDKDISLKNFTDTYELKFSRVPGYEQLDQVDYAKLMLGKLEVQRLGEVARWKAKGHSFLGKARLRKIKPGTLPKRTKTGSRRPILLCACAETRKEVLNWYFQIVRTYREAALRMKRDKWELDFPPLTYPPPPGLVPA